LPPAVREENVRPPSVDEYWVSSVTGPDRCTSTDTRPPARDTCGRVVVSVPFVVGSVSATSQVVAPRGSRQ